MGGPLHDMLTGDRLPKLRGHLGGREAGELLNSFAHENEPLHTILSVVGHGTGRGDGTAVEILSRPGLRFGDPQPLCILPSPLLAAL